MRLRSLHHRFRVPFVALLASAVYSLTSLAGIAGTGVAKTPYTVASGPYALIGPPQRMWTDADGVLHIHGLAAAGPMTGDYGGSISLINYEDIDTNTGEGTYHGTFVWQTVVDGRSGAFEG